MSNDELLSLTGECAKELANVLVPLSLATPPTPEFVSFAFAMTEDQSAKTIISLIGCVAAVQIHTAKCVSTWLAPDFRADPSSPCTRDWSTSARALHRTLVEADQFRTIETSAIEAFKSAIDEAGGGTPRTKKIAGLLYPVVAPCDAIITFCHDTFKAMTTRAQQKIAAILIDGAAGLWQKPPGEFGGGFQEPPHLKVRV